MSIVVRGELENGVYLLLIRASTLSSRIISCQGLAQINFSISNQDSAIGKMLEQSLRSLY